MSAEGRTPPPPEWEAHSHTRRVLAELDEQSNAHFERWQLASAESTDPKVRAAFAVWAKVMETRFFLAAGFPEAEAPQEQQEDE